MFLLWLLSFSSMLSRSPSSTWPLTPSVVSSAELLSSPSSAPLRKKTHWKC
jgi:hypothetical protein